MVLAVWVVCEINFHVGHVLYIALLVQYNNVRYITLRFPGFPRPPGTVSDRTELCNSVIEHTPSVGIVSRRINA